MVCRIDGRDEADINEDRLSVTAPLAQALIGKEKGESVVVNTPRGAKAYEIISVRFV